MPCSSVRAPLVEAPDLRYVLGLQEGSVVAMADGYARAARRTSMVSLHVAAGVANGLIGMLNALRSRTPMVIVAGQQDRRHLVQDPMLSGDLVGLASAATKHAVEVQHARDLPVVLRRAFALAARPPAGARARVGPHHYTPGPAVPDGLAIVQVDEDPGEIGRNFAVRHGLTGDLAGTLRALADRLDGLVPSARERAERLGAEHARAREKVEQAARAAYGAAPMDPRAAAHAVASGLPDRAVVVEEAITVGLKLRAVLRQYLPGSYVHTVGGGLGWGIGAAVGTRMADHRRPPGCSGSTRCGRARPVNCGTRSPRSRTWRPRC
jgi:thiamine pyrophosphate-dependent acetolactate synthase large subunit-like protein